MGSRARELAFLVLLLLGVVALVAGLLRTRLSWRDDVSPFSRRTPQLDVLLHPERYARGDTVRATRTLDGSGALLLAIAVAVLRYEAVPSPRESRWVGATCKSMN
jgi:hypothetical protein